MVTSGFYAFRFVIFYHSLYFKNILRELGRATAEEIYQRVSLNGNFRTFFNDIEDLKSLLRSLQRKDWVIKESPKQVYLGLRFLRTMKKSFRCTD